MTWACYVVQTGQNKNAVLVGKPENLGVDARIILTRDFKDVG
jgi:hypothetical protein